MENDDDDECNVNNFTDEELFHLMDLNNPTDRELEAKLYLLIEKYEGNKNKLSIKMCRFFNDVFRHFFSTDDDIELEGFETQNTNNISTVSSQTVVTTPIAPTPPVTTVSSNYSKGLLNPLLKETIKRIVCIDSQYRDLSIYPNSANFTFNLSDTLTDVVSLKLYSIQIPYTWYTISNDFGSNFFILKGNVEGIDNGNFDFKVEIQPGNYQSNDLVTYINESLRQIIENNKNINFGTTAVSYNSVNAKLTITLDITILYNETNYELEFSGSTSNDNNIVTSIPGLLGYTKSKYHPFLIKSDIHSAVPTGINMSRVRNITEYNNGFHIDIYKGMVVNNEINNGPSSTIMMTITITMSLLGPHTTQEIITDIDTQLKLNEYIDAANSFFDYDTNEKRIVLKVRLNKKKIENGQNYKTKIRFVDYNEYPVWFQVNTRGQYTSLFKFPKDDMELNEIESHSDYLITTYEIQEGSNDADDTNTTILPTLSYKSRDPNYQYLDKNIEIPSGTYTSIELATEINDRLLTLNQDTSGEFDCLFTDVSSNHVISSVINRIIPYYYNEVVSPNSIVIVKNFLIYVNRSFFNSIFDFTSAKLNVIPDSSSTLVDQTFRSTNISTATGNSLIEIKNLIGTIFLTMKNNQGGDDIFTNVSFVVLKDGNYSLQDIVTKTNAFFEQETHIQNVSFKGSSIRIIEVNNGLECILTLKIRVVLTNKDFDLHLDDPTNNIWSSIFGFEEQKFNSQGNPLYDFSENTLLFSSSGISLANDALGNLLVIDLDENNLTYDLSENPPLVDSDGNNILFNESGVAVTTFENLIPPLYDYNDRKRVYTEVPISVMGIKKLYSNLLYLTTNNNYFTFKPILDEYGGVYVNSSSSKYDIIITLSLVVNKYYTREAIVENINLVLRKNKITNGSFLKEEEEGYHTIFKVNINKTFTAEDYRLIFFDNTFTRCNFGKSSIDSVKWDTTLGWILGFRNQTQYILTKINMINLLSTTTYYTDYPNQPYSVDPITNIVTITGDTSINVNLFNYLLVVLDDYCQNHLNDGLVTVTKTDYDIPLPSYANRTTYQCDASGQLSIVNGKLTSKQLYSANQILNTKQINQKQNAYSSGPFTQDIFAFIPIKTTGLSPGQSIVDFSGTLQNQERTYFGPVNIRKMTIQLLNDKGSTLDLNGANWSFSFITEQLYNPSRN